MRMVTSEIREQWLASPIQPEFHKAIYTWRAVEMVVILREAFVADTVILILRVNKS